MTVNNPNPGLPVFQILGQDASNNVPVTIASGSFSLSASVAFPATQAVTGSLALSQGSVFNFNSSSYWTANSVTANTNMPSVDTSKAWGISFNWTLNSGLSANLLTGSIASQTSDDGGTTWVDTALGGGISRVAVTLGPGNLTQSGSFNGPVFHQNTRLQLSYAAGSNCSLTSSLTIKS